MYEKHWHQQKRQKQNSKGLKNNFLGPTSTSAEAVFSNEDLLHEILLHVPARSLVRFKCVSKYWLDLISDQKFCYDHSTQNRESISALYFHLGSLAYQKLKSVSFRGDQNLPNLSFLCNKGLWSITVRKALNGLTLCSYGRPEKYIVCNLTTQKYRIIMEKEEDIKSDIILCCLAYDPAVSPYYKIVLFGKNCFGSYHIYIYSSEKSSWTQFHVPELANIFVVSSAFFNGSVHCVNSYYYFRFEVDTEKLTKMDILPSEPGILERNNVNFFGEYGGNFFGECGGNLLLVQYSARYIERLKILQMDMETNRWILKQCASLRTLPKSFPDDRIKFNLLTILKGSHEGDVVLVLLIEGKVIAFYPNCKKIKTICETPYHFSCLKYVQWGGAYQHFESLSPV